MPETPPVPIEDQIRAVDRELALRRNVYAKRVKAEKMKPEEARAELDAMTAVGATLRAVAQAEPLAVALLAAVGYDLVDPQPAGTADGGDGPPASDAVSAELCASRLDLADSADLATLRQWYAQARDAWPEPQRTRMMEACQAAAEGQPRAYADGKPPQPALSS